MLANILILRSSIYSYYSIFFSSFFSNCVYMDTASQEDFFLLEKDRSAYQAKIESQNRANKKRRDAIKCLKKVRNIYRN